MLWRLKRVIRRLPLSDQLEIWIMIMVVFVITGMVLTKSEGIAKQKQALDGLVIETAWYEDSLKWIDNEKVLVKGLKKFYQKTGVQPYILFIPYSNQYWNGLKLDIEKAERYLNSVYNKEFSDGAHIIFAYFESKNDSKAEVKGEFQCFCGQDAAIIVDEEARDILWGYFRRNDSKIALSLEEKISNTFSETAESIMKKEVRIFDIIAVVLAIMIVIMVVYWSKR